MFLLFLIIWIVFNGRFSWEVLGIGLALCVPLVIFFSKFMGYTIRSELRLLVVDHVGDPLCRRSAARDHQGKF